MSMDNSVILRIGQKYNLAFVKIPYFYDSTTMSLISKPTNINDGYYIYPQVADTNELIDIAKYLDYCGDIETWTTFFPLLIEKGKEEEAKKIREKSMENNEISFESFKNIPIFVRYIDYDYYIMKCHTYADQYKQVLEYICKNYEVKFKLATFYYHNGRFERDLEYYKKYNNPTEQEIADISKINIYMNFLKLINPEIYFYDPYFRFKGNL